MSDSVEHWLPGLVPTGRSITIHELLDHTSGIYKYTGDPGFIAAGQGDPARIWSPRELVALATAFVRSLREVNPAASVILTASPVPLFATAVDRHVLVSTTYSKSVLRIAAQALVESLEDVYYFPAYEIVAGNFSRGAYFASDLRSIREPGVEHVMSLFFRHATTDAGRADDGVGQLRASQSAAAQAFELETEKVIGLLCDEELIALDESAPAA